MLNNRQRKILNFLYTNENYLLCELYEEFQISKDYDADYHILLRDKYIDINHGKDWKEHTVHLTPDGKAIVEKELQDEQLRKEQYRHNWRVAICSSICGAISGLITSIVFWLITSSSSR